MGCERWWCRGWAVALTVVLATGVGAAPWQGRPLVEALEELRHGPLAAAGWALVYSSELVAPGMRVVSEPEAREPRRLLAQLLAPHGLAVEEGAEGVLVVVRGGAPPGSAPRPGEAGGEGGEDAAASPRAPLQTVSDEIVVRPSRYSFLQDEPGAGAVLGRDEIERLPHLGDDPFRLATLLPGTAGSDVSARFSVRGGRRDEVRVVLDGLELYEPYHLRDYDGALSVVPARTLEGMSLTTGAYPASRGDRMSGVLDLRTLRPPELRLILGLGALDAFAAAGGRLGGGAGDEAGGWLASGRLGSLALAGDAVGNEEPSFWDGLAKVEVPSPLGRFALRALATDDDLRVDTADEDDFEHLDNGWSSRYTWATHTWSGESWLVESLASWGGLDRNRRAAVREEEGEYALLDRRDVDVVSLSQEVSWQASPRRLSRAGWEARRYEVDFDYAKDLELDLEVEAPFSPPRRTRHTFRDTVQGDDLALWVSHREAEPGGLERLTAELGLRYDRHNASDGTVLSPRVNLAWRLGEAQLLRLAWGRFTQSQRPYELQVEDAETRLWPVERSRQWVLGYEALLGGAGAGAGRIAGVGRRPARRGPRAESLRVELFHRRVANPRPRYENLLEPLNFFPEVEPDRVRLDPTSSTAYGVEVLLQGRWGRRARGFVAYTWSRSEDRIPGLVGGEDDVPRRFDQPHALVANADLPLPWRWHLNLAWRFHSGWPTTPVELLAREGGADGDDGGEGDGEGDGGPVARFGRPYSRRLPDYHRLDLRASRRWPWRLGSKRGTLTFYVDVQNVYDRANLAGFDLAVDDDVLKLEAESWPGVVPSAGFVLELGGPGR